MDETIDVFTLVTHLLGEDGVIIFLGIMSSLVDLVTICRFLENNRFVGYSLQDANMCARGLRGMCMYVKACRHGDQLTNITSVVRLNVV